MAFRHGQAAVAAAAIALCLRHSVPDRLRGRLELARQLLRRASCLHQLDQPVTKFRGITSPRIRHRGLLERKCSDVHQTGSTSDGLLEHARASTAFSNPTIKGYKRRNVNPLAPKRVVWSYDNKGAMCRPIGGMGDPATHIENRSGEPAANPYLYMGSQIVAGLDGIANRIDPGSLVPDPYAQVEKPQMPASLGEAVDALSASTMFREAFGNEFIDHYASMRRQEIGRFESHVTDWEHREYFETF